MEAQEIQRNVDKLKSQLDEQRKKLEHLEKNCVDPKGHVWGDVKFNPEYREGYVIPSDLDRGIYLGVDTIVSRTYVPPETIKKWTRQCKKCGTTQTTQRTKKVSGSGSIPWTTSVQDVPDFSSPSSSFLK